MKSIKFLTAILATVIFFASCSTDQKAQLSKLKEQKTAIDEKIKILQHELDSLQKGKINTDEFKLVAVTEARTDKFDHFIRVQGRLDGDQNVGVFAEVPGTIIAKNADVGQQVKKNQVLAQIDDKQYRSQLEGLESQYKLAQELYDKQKRLWDQKIGSEVQYLQSKTNKESLEQQIASMKEQLEKFRIKSPIEGTIEECNIKVGGVVSPDPRQAAYRVVAFRDLKVTAEVSEAYSSKVNKGDKLIVNFPDLNLRVDAVVSFVSNYINPVNRTFQIEANINGRYDDLKANMIAILQINDYHSDNAILLPMNIVQTDAGGSYVYVARQKDEYEAAFKQPVVIGNTYNGIAEITQGINAGDKVVSTGYQELVNGEYIRF